MRNLSTLSLTTAALLIFQFWSRPAAASTGEKVLQFPKEHSFGWILDVPKDPGTECNIHGVRLAKAQGLVRLPANRHLLFEPAGQCFKQPEAMLKLPTDAFEYIVVRFTAMDDSEEDLNDKMIPYITHIKSLRTVSLDRTDTTDGAASKLTVLPKLEALSFSASLVTGTCLAQLQNCKSLKFLRFGDTHIDEPSLKYLSNLPNLKRLSLVRVGLTKKGLEHISKCTNLVNLAISKNPAIDDSCIPLLLKLKNLTDLDISGTKISKASFEKLAVLKNVNISSPQPFSTYTAKEKAHYKKLFPAARFDHDVFNINKINRETNELFGQSYRLSKP